MAIFIIGISDSDDLPQKESSIERYVLFIYFLDHRPQVCDASPLLFVGVSSLTSSPLTCSCLWLAILRYALELGWQHEGGLLFPP